MPTTLATSELPPFSLSPSAHLATFCPHQRAAPHYTWKIPQHSLIRAAGSGATERGRGRESYSDCCFLSAYSAVLCVKLIRMFCQLHATPQSNRQQHDRSERESEKGGERGKRVCWQHPPVRRRRMMMMMPTAMALSCAQRQKDTIVLTGRRLKIKQSIIKNRKQIVKMWCEKRLLNWKIP